MKVLRYLHCHIHKLYKGNAPYTPLPIEMELNIIGKIYVGKCAQKPI